MAPRKVELPLPSLTTVHRRLKSVPSWLVTFWQELKLRTWLPSCRPQLLCSMQCVGLVALAVPIQSASE